MNKPILFLCLLAATPAFAADLAFTLMPPVGPVAAGHKIQVDLVAMNPRGTDVPFWAPSALPGRLDGAAGNWSVALEATGPSPQAVNPGGFATRHYAFTLPAGATGRLVLEAAVTDGARVQAVLDITAGESTAGPAVTPLTRLNASAPVASMLARTFAGRFLPNQPIYFLYGSGSDQAAKFQFSFDYRLATLRWGEPGREKLSTLRLGYTQRSLWDIDARSSPFYDTSYMPEVAVNTDLALRGDGQSRFTWMGFRAGFLHESNGRDGADSRSLNTLYIRPRFILGSLDSWFLVALPELQAYIGGFGENPRIKDYRGYGKLRFYFGKNAGPTLRVAAWAGKDLDHPTCQLDLTFPFRSRWLNMESFLQVQYFNGYGESLRAYTTRSDAVRFGIALVR